MGDPKKPRKKWSGPRHPWRKDILIYETKLLGQYGLRNKKELWRASSMIRYFRHRARSLLGEPAEIREVEGKILISKLVKLGLLKEGSRLEDALNLKVEDLLERRLQTIVYKKGLANTIYQARQLIVHGHIAVAGRRITSPGYIASVEEEPLVDYAPFSPFKEKPIRQVQQGGA
ncbi:MAG: 30S ribosomal protein S4 [Thermosphaera aggregans]|jgi:small subunit ribosomal protein S4|uniref:30S ribosomal protein S4 n=1 Tax=Thermosphaera aggregans TaxID=54254 RepID=UPI003C0AEE39